MRREWETSRGGDRLSTPQEGFQKPAQHSHYGKTNLEDEAPESDTRHLVSVHTLE